MRGGDGGEEELKVQSYKKSRGNLLGRWEEVGDGRTGVWRRQRGGGDHGPAPSQSCRG